jgi:NADPH2 dehydrogenase
MSSIVVAGGYTPDADFETVNGEYRDYEVTISFSCHYLANQNLPYRIKEGRPFNRYGCASFYAPFLPKSLTNHLFSLGFVAGKPFSGKSATLRLTPERSHSS